jgi:hypothetical protein
VDRSSDLAGSTARFAPGLHVETDPRPLVRAQALAEELAGRLCTTGEEAGTLLDDLATLPPLPPEGLAVLGALADRVQAAERIVGRTVERAAETVGERLAEAGTGMAIHPSAVRDRAAAVLTARELAQAAEERLREAEAEVEAAEAADAERRAVLPPPVAHLQPSEVDSRVDEPPARRRRLFRWRREPEVEDTSESTSLLQQVAATTDEAFGARRAASARDDRLLLLRVQRDRAVEDVRVTERAWRDLAGDDPVEDVEAVVRRFDPQHQDALVVAKETIGVRAVSTLLAQALERWTEAWRGLGFDAPAVEPSAMPDVHARCTSAVVLAGGAVERAHDIATAAPAAPVVTVEGLEPSPATPS